METRKCLRCDHDLEAGFIFDHTVAGSAQLSWGRGEPVKSVMRGVVAESGLNPIPITTYRCKKCGRLELYVTEPTPEPETHR